MPRASRPRARPSVRDGASSTGSDARQHWREDAVPEKILTGAEAQRPREAWHSPCKTDADRVHSPALGLARFELSSSLGWVARSRGRRGAGAQPRPAPGRLRSLGKLAGGPRGSGSRAGSRSGGEHLARAAFRGPRASRRRFVREVGDAGALSDARSDLESRRRSPRRPRRHRARRGPRFLLLRPPRPVCRRLAARARGSAWNRAGHSGQQRKRSYHAFPSALRRVSNWHFPHPCNRPGSAAAASRPPALATGGVAQTRTAARRPTESRGHWLIPGGQKQHRGHRDARDDDCDASPEIPARKEGRIRQFRVSGRILSRNQRPGDWCVRLGIRRTQGDRLRP
jgi:hypothetical protein